MKNYYIKILFIPLIYLSLLIRSENSFSQTFDFSDATTTSNTLGANPRTVSETLSGITMTVRSQHKTASSIDQTGYLNTSNSNGDLGTTGGVEYHLISSEIGAVTITFDTPVDVNRLKMGSTYTDESRTWTFTPVGGTNSVVTKTSNFSGNVADILLNWTSITQITITSNYTIREQFILDSATLGAPTPPVYTWTGAFNNDWGTSLNWNPTSVPSTDADIIIPGGLTNYPTASSAVLCNSLTINSGASFIPQSTVTGTVTYKRNLPTTNWYLVSSPIANETLQNIIANNTFATGTVGGNIGIGSYTNDGATPWIYYNTASTGNVIPGVGVSVKLATPGEITSTGTALNTSNVIFDITATGSRNKFNLLGNPFTAYVNSATFASLNTGALTEETIWLWDGTNYTTRNNLTDIEIAPGQAFFVEALSDTAILFNTDNRTHQNTDTFMKGGSTSNFELFIENEDTKMSTKVFYVDGKTTGFDNGYDSKMFGGTGYELAVFTELLTNNEGEKLAIQALPNVDLETMIVPIGVIAKKGEEITFSMESVNVSENGHIYLEDKLTGEYTNLSKTTYKTNLTESLNGIGRFYMHTTNSVLSDNTNVALENISIYKLDNTTLRIAGSFKNDVSFKLFTILGKEILKASFTSNSIKDIYLPQLAKGVYLVQLETENGTLNKKIILE
jgi:hypothetical protein